MSMRSPFDFTFYKGLRTSVRLASDLTLYSLPLLPFLGQLVRPRPIRPTEKEGPLSDPKKGNSLEYYLPWEPGGF